MRVPVHALILKLYATSYLFISRKITKIVVLTTLAGVEQERMISMALYH